MSECLNVHLYTNAWIIMYKNNNNVSFEFAAQRPGSTGATLKKYIYFFGGLFLSQHDCFRALNPEWKSCYFNSTFLGTLVSRLKTGQGVHTFSRVRVYTKKLVQVATFFTLVYPSVRKILERGAWSWSVTFYAPHW